MGLGHGLIVLMARSVAKDKDDDGGESALDVEEPMSEEQVRAVHRRSMVC